MISMRSCSDWHRGRRARSHPPIGRPRAGLELRASEQAKGPGIGSVTMATADPQVAVIGGGVVGCAIAHAFTRRGVEGGLPEGDPGLGPGASGTNSGILHTGFDATPGELETTLILRSVALRDELLEELGVVAWRCGALLQPADDDERASVGKLSET